MSLLLAKLLPTLQLRFFWLLLPLLALQMLLAWLLLTELLLVELLAGLS
jgi:hypothetical protein